MEYEDHAIEVAIKTLNQCPTKSDFKDFQREIAVMRVSYYRLSIPLNILTKNFFLISAIESFEYCKNHHIHRSSEHRHHNGVRQARVLP